MAYHLLLTTYYPVHNTYYLFITYQLFPISYHLPSTAYYTVGQEFKTEFLGTYRTLARAQAQAHTYVRICSRVQSHSHTCCVRMGRWNPPVQRWNRNVA